MRKIAAFLTALVIFTGIITGMHYYAYGRLDMNSKEFSSWTREAKYAAGSAIAANLNEDTIVTFGSSELEHGKDTPYHPKNLFKGQKFNMMLVGAGYYQSLSHAITLAAIEPEMENRKVVLIVAPQWFRKSGVKADAYASRFSEGNFISMLENDKLSEETKNYIMDRTKHLLVNDQATLKRVNRYDRMFLKGESTWMDSFYFRTYHRFLEEKSVQSIVSWANIDGISQKEDKSLGESSIDWDACRAQAAFDGKAGSEGNDFHILKKYYEKNLYPQLEERKGSGVDSSYCTSPEYDDLRCFLKVCQELSIEPLLVNVPVNGLWYDYTGFPKDDRQQYYENIRTIAKEYGAQVADFSDREYEPYFLEDTIHIGWKGWVDVCESIYEYAQQDKQQ